jgi:hypothetical protein
VPNVFPVHAMMCGRAMCWIVDVIDAGPDFRLNSVPGATSPSIEKKSLLGFGRRRYRTTGSSVLAAEGSFIATDAAAGGAGVRSCIGRGWQIGRP